MTRDKLADAIRSAAQDMPAIAKLLLYPILLILAIIFDAAHRS